MCTPRAIMHDASASAHVSLSVRATVRLSCMAIRPLVTLQPLTSVWPFDSLWLHSENIFGIPPEHSLPLPELSDQTPAVEIPLELSLPMSELSHRHTRYQNPVGALSTPARALSRAHCCRNPSTTNLARILRPLAGTPATCLVAPTRNLPCSPLP
ncbi:hypothetical protein AMTR_s00076p00107470 [Amborella trichopoda]|uniref:Uncharacterized protein n=1 Tax=Amborella trichopoda TaxID=13333 RepID=W1PAI1_AMBTC|nr:hypothetical protein AMTR_s00076p00107470 [Amborella trichopoda]